MRSHAEGGHGEGPKTEKPSDAKAEEGSEYTYTYETEEGEDTKEEENGGDEDEGEPEVSPPDKDCVEDYFRRRTCIFVHHCAGAEDPLTDAMLMEAAKQKVLLKTFSIEKNKGTGDLLQDEPYATHLRCAKRGYIDAYH